MRLFWKAPRRFQGSYEKYNIPTAGYENFEDSEKALEYLRTQAKFPVVLKADGLALGKGVLICNDLAEAEAGVKEIMEDKSSEAPEILWSLKNL